MWKKAPKSGSGSKDLKKTEELKRAYAFLAWLDPFIALRNTKSNLEDEDDEEKNDETLPPADFSDSGDDDEKEGDDVEDDFDDDENGEDEEDEEDDRDEKDDNTSIESPSVTVPVKPAKTKMKAKKRIINEQPPTKSTAKKPRRAKDITQVERKEIGLLNTLQSSILTRNNEKKKTVETTDELFGKMIGEDLKALPPISKLQARNDIQNVIFRYRMAAMQDSLQRKLNSTSSESFSPGKTAREPLTANNFGTSFQNNFSPNGSTSSNNGAHWIHNMNAMNTFDY